MPLLFSCPARYPSHLSTSLSTSPPPSCLSKSLQLHLKGQSLPGSAPNSIVDVGATDKVVRVRRGPITRGSVVGGPVEREVVDSGVSGLGAVAAADGDVCGDESGGLDEQLRAHARVDGVAADAVVVVVVDVDLAETDGGQARVAVEPEVVGVGDGQVSGVLGAVVVAVAHQRGFPVVVQEGVGDGDKVGGVGDVDEAVVEVFAAVEVGGEVAVVDPDVGGFVDADGVAFAVVDIVDADLGEVAG